MLRIALSFFSNLMTHFFSRDPFPHVTGWLAGDHTISTSFMWAVSDGFCLVRGYTHQVFWAHPVECRTLLSLTPFDLHPCTQGTLALCNSLNPLFSMPKRPSLFFFMPACPPPLRVVLCYVLMGTAPSPPWTFVPRRRPAWSIIFFFFR